MKFCPLIISILVSCSSLKPVQQSNDRLLSDLETLSSDKYEGRKTGTKGNDLAREFIIQRFKDLGLSAYPSQQNYTSEFDVKSRNGTVIKGHNVIGYIKGKSNDVIVVSAHYDHVGIINNEIYNGADDNASGVSALLKYAEYFSKNKPEHTLVFAAFDAEEMGLQGAKAFVTNPPVALSDIRMNINMDMISHNDKGELYVAGTFLYPQLKPYLVTTNPDIKVLAGHDDPKLGQDDWTNQSDQGAFNAKKIPFLYFGVEDHKDYHKATDEFQNINKKFFVDAAGSILDIIKNIDKDRDLQKIFREKLQINKQ